MSAQNIPNPTQTQTNPNPNPIRLLWQKYKEKILVELMADIEKMMEERKCDMDISEKIKKFAKIYTLAKLEIIKKLKISDDDAEILKKIIMQGWNDDIECNYREADIYFDNEIFVECVAGGRKFYFSFSIVLKSVTELTKEEYMKYSMLRNKILLEKYEEIIKVLEKILSKYKEIIEEC